jgi:DNA polymerase III epsilon subunit-like protein
MRRVPSSEWLLSGGARAAARLDLANGGGAFAAGHGPQSARALESVEAAPPACRPSKRGVPQRFLALDVETTGFAPADDRIIEIAWVLFADGQPISSHTSLVDPRRPIPMRVTEMTGLDAQALRGQPRLRALAPKIVAAIAQVPMVVAYNAPFDRRFVSAELARAGQVLPQVPWVDALALARDADKRVASGKGAFALASSCARHGVLLSQAHRALDDARACGELFVRLRGETGGRSLAARLIHKTRALFA